MTDLFAQHLQALRARSLDRHLREIGSAQGPTIEIVGQELVIFPRMTISVSRTIPGYARLPARLLANSALAQALHD